MESAQDIRQCLECKKTCIEPRSLACFHTFCLRCLLQSIERKETTSAKELACPVCDKKYTVPKTGLQRNDFISRLIKMSKEPSPSSKDKVNCGTCSKDNENKAGSEIPLASVYCTNCQKVMCDQCDVKHSRKNSTSSHIAFGLGSQQDHEAKESARHEGNQCLEHQKKQVELYCKECKAIICITCFAETHKSHDCIDLDKHKDPLCKQIEKNREKTSGCLENCRAMRQRLDVVEREFLEAADAAEVDIDERCEELKQMVDKHEKKLKEELKRNKELKLSEISESRTRLDELIRDLKTLEAYCSELASNGSSVEMARDIAGMTERKTELQQLQEKQAEYEILSMNVFFKPRELDNFQKDADNIVGSIDVTTSGVVKCEEENRISLHADVWGVTKTFEEENRISLYADVWGVTKTGGSIYVLCRTCVYNSISVYNDQPPFRLIQEIKLKKVVLPVDMVSKETDDNLYVSDRANKCVWKISHKSWESKWLTGISWPFTLAVTRGGYLVILRNSQPSRLELYGSNGSLVETFQLPVECQSPRHAVETPDGDFVVLHKCRDAKGKGNMVWSVSKVNRFGQTIRRFHPSKDSEVLHKPCHLVLCQEEEVFVADPGRDSVARLNSGRSCKAIRRPRATSRLRWPPRRLFYDAEGDTILVGQEFGGVLLYKCKLAHD